MMGSGRGLRRVEAGELHAPLTAKWRTDWKEATAGQGTNSEVLLRPSERK